MKLRNLPHIYSKEYGGAEDARQEQKFVHRMSMIQLKAKTSRLKKKASSK